jgi:hypothetical protein
VKWLLHFETDLTVKQVYVCFRALSIRRLCYSRGVVVYYGRKNFRVSEDSNEVETNYASFDFHFRVLFFRFGNSLLYYIKLGTSV